MSREYGRMKRRHLDLKPHIVRTKTTVLSQILVLLQNVLFLLLGRSKPVLYPAQAICDNS